MRRRLACPAVLAASALFAAPLAAQSPDAVTVALELRATDCALTEDDELPFVAATGLTEEAVIAVVIGAVGDGWMTADDATETLALIPALCDPAAAGDMGATLTALLRVNGCRIAEDVADTQFPLFGLTQDMTRDVGGAMIAAGDLSEEGDTILLSAALCDGTGAVLPSPRGAMVAAMRAADCALGRDDAQAAMVAAGVDSDVATELLGAWEASGLLTQSASGETGSGMLHLDSGMCAGAAPAAPFMDPVAQTVAALRRLPGCSGTEDSLELMFETMEELLPDAVMNLAEIRVDAMMAVGDIVEQGDRILLSAELCGGGPGLLAGVTGQLADAARRNGCRLEEGQADATFAVIGVTSDMIEAAAEAMVANGDARFVGDSLVLSDALCAAVPDPAPQPASNSAALAIIAAETPESAAFRIDGIMRLAGCTLPLPDAAALDSRLAAPLGQALGVNLGADPAVDAGLRDLAVQALNVLRGAGKVEWSGATGMARLLACP